MTATTGTTPRQLDVLSVGWTPVKGTRHLAGGPTPFDGAGPVGDRVYCLVDEQTGGVFKTVQHPTLVQVLARLHGEELELSLPTGEAVREVPTPAGRTITGHFWSRSLDLELTEGPHTALLSEHLGRPVRLARVPRGGVVFGAPVSLVTTASLRDLGDRAGHDGLLGEAARMRATLVVDTTEPYVEETWDGTLVRAGDLLLRVGAPIPRCAVMDLHPTTGARGGRLLKTLAGYRPRTAAGEPCFGVYAHVVG